RRRLCFGEARPARIGQIVKRQHLHRMTVRADFPVNLEAPLELRRIISPEWSGKRPLQTGRGHLLLGLRGERQPGDRAYQRESENSALHRHDSAPAHAFAPKTDSEIEFGSGLVFSKMPSSGMMIRKNAK